MADTTKRPVSGDTLAYVMVINVRYLPMVGGAAVKKEHGKLTISERDEKNLLICRRLHRRFLNGDYRMNQMEYQRFRDATDWIQRTDRRNKGQPDKPPAQRDELHAWRGEVLPPKTYQSLILELKSGRFDQVA